jgi:hypothetical protein
MSANVSLVLNATAVLLVGTAVAIGFPVVSDHFLSIGMAYIAGLLTATASRYSITINRSHQLLKNDITRKD